VKPSDRIYWMRTSLAVGAGVASTFLAIYSDLGNALAVAATVAIYLLSYILARHYVARDLPRDQSRQWYTKGIGTFIIVWLWIWVFLYTLLG
jgi:uncharacterized membrane protein YGL010W